MAKRNIIVVGASAGGVLALTQFVRQLPANLDAAVFVVLHLPPNSPSNLPAILSRSGPLKAHHPKDGEPIEHGRIYVARPDHHLLLEDDKVLVRRGPKENRFRPSIDALFRSAAYVHGPSVIGVILSGMLDDGTSGMWTIKRLGGLCIVESPEEATYPSMPLNTLEQVSVDHSLAAESMGPLLAGLVQKRAPRRPKVPKTETKLMEMEVVIAMQDDAFEMGIMDMGSFTPFTCPECHGALVSLSEGDNERFRCHTGHAYTPSALLADITEVVEQKLWQAMQGMETATMLLKSMGQHFAQAKYPEASRLFFEKARKTAEQARILHHSISEEEKLSEDIRHEAFTRARKMTIPGRTLRQQPKNRA